MGILDQFKLDGQAALVTGCKRGIGKAMAIALAEAGADIIGVSATLETRGSEVEQAVAAAGRDFKAYAYDFSPHSRRTLGGAPRLCRSGGFSGLSSLRLHARRHRPG